MQGGVLGHLPLQVPVARVSKDVDSACRRSRLRISPRCCKVLASLYVRKTPLTWHSVELFRSSRWLAVKKWRWSVEVQARTQDGLIMHGKEITSGSQFTPFIVSFLHGIHSYRSCIGRCVHELVTGNSMRLTGSILCWDADSDSEPMKV